jgi:hypothetical protein
LIFSFSFFFFDILRISYLIKKKGISIALIYSEDRWMVGILRVLLFFTEGVDRSDLALF